MLQRIRTWLRTDLMVMRWIFLGLYLGLIMALFLAASGNSNARRSILVLIGILVGSQVLFIFGAGTMQLCQPIRRRRLWMPVVVAGLMLTLLLTGLGVAMTEAFGLEKMIEGKDRYFWVLLGGNWVFWSALIWVLVRPMPRMAALSRLARALFVGSLAELLACVPAHLIVSRRPGCFVGFMTAAGIATGLFVMLFSFGPAIVLLFLRPRYRADQESATPGTPPPPGPA